MRTSIPETTPLSGEAIGGTASGAMLAATRLSRTRTAQVSFCARLTAFLSILSGTLSCSMEARSDSGFKICQLFRRW